MRLTTTQVDRLTQTAKQAGRAIMEIYASENFGTEMKDDSSPVTDADIAANAVIMRQLATEFPDIFVVSEEVELPATTVLPAQFFLVDPLDGTKSFIKKTGEFTVNIGLINDGAPVWGVVHVPVSDVTYFVGADGAAYQQLGDDIPQKIAVRPAPKEGLTIMASQSHLDSETKNYIENLPAVTSFQSVGSSLKFCRVAEGAVDVYPRFGPTMEWDTAAAHAVLNAAGGSVVQPDGSVFTYGHMAQPRPLLNGPFIARGAVE